MVVFHGIERYAAAVSLYYLPCEEETHSSSFSSCLGCEEGVEYLVDDSLLDADAVVVDAYLDIGIGRLQRQIHLRGVVLFLGLLVNCINRIGEYRQQGLVDGLRIYVGMNVGSNVGSDVHLVILLRNVSGLLAEAREIGIAWGAYTAVKHRLHSTQGMCGVDTVLLNLTKILAHHVKDVHTVFITIF